MTDWHAAIGDSNQADDICDRLLHDAHRIELKGRSMMTGEQLGVGHPTRLSVSDRGTVDQPDDRPATVTPAGQACALPSPVG